MVCVKVVVTRIIDLCAVFELRKQTFSSGTDLRLESSQTVE